MLQSTVKKLFVCVVMLLLTTATAFGQSSEEDVVGYVIPETAELYAKPNDKAAVLENLNQSQMVLILDSKTNPKWLKVFSTAGKEGWVKTEDIETSPETSAVLRELVKTLDPSVKISNNSNIPVTIRIAGASHKIPAKKQKVVRFKAGSYPYTVSAPGFSNGAGTKYFEAGRFYTWNFSIVTRVVKRRTRRG